MDKKNILHMDIKDLFKIDLKINAKNIIILVCIFLGVIVYAYFIVYPKYIEFSNVNRKLSMVNSQLKDDENKLDTRQQLNEELQNLARQANEKSKRLSYDMQDGMFLVGLSNMMSKNSIELLNYSIDPSVKYENFYAIPTTLQVRGNYRYIREIMYYLEEQQNVTQIQNFNMEAYKKPELSNTSTEQGTTQPIDVKKENKQNGDVTATFKFIMYMSQDPSLKLEIENPNNWNPGKFNPFVSSTN